MDKFGGIFNYSMKCVRGNRMCSKYFLPFVILCALCCSHVLAKNDSKELLERNKRVVPFLQGAGCGFIAAMAVPLQKIGRHVFMAFNFEAHYGLADNNTFSPSVVKHLFQGKRSVDNEPQLLVKGDQGEATSARKKKNSNKLFTRTRVYRAIEKNLLKMGYNGTACLVKLICETAEVPVNPNNGILGSIFHVLFTPSSSEDEGLPPKYYDAEINGTQGDCSNYNTDCPNGMIDIISKTMFLK